MYHRWPFYQSDRHVWSRFVGVDSCHGTHNGLVSSNIVVRRLDCFQEPRLNQLNAPVVCAFGYAHLVDSINMLPSVLSWTFILRPCGSA